MSTKVGVIGAGGMLQYHAAGFRQAGAEIVAVADAAPGAAAKAAEQWGIASAYDSVEAMLAGSPEIEAVSIIVPNKFHKPLTIQCLEAGKHVFSEKPPALNAGEVQEIIAAANSRKCFFPPQTKCSTMLATAHPAMASEAADSRASKPPGTVGASNTRNLIS